MIEHAAAQHADLDVRVKQDQIRRDLQRTDYGVVFRVEVSFVMDGHVARAALDLDARGAEIGTAGGNEPRQPFERFRSRAQHRAYQMMPGLWIGEDLADEQSLVNF